MEGIDLALLIQISKGFKLTLPRPTGFANFRGAGQPFFPRGGAHIPALDMFANNAHTIFAAHGKVVFFSYN